MPKYETFPNFTLPDPEVNQMVTLNFSGIISDQPAIQDGTLEIKRPDGITDKIAVFTAIDKTWAASKTYTVLGNYVATIKFHEVTTSTAVYRACEASIAIPLLTDVARTVSIVVNVVP